jgi:hypothetical protein
VVDLGPYANAPSVPRFRQRLLARFAPFINIAQKKVGATVTNRADVVSLS